MLFFFILFKNIIIFISFVRHHYYFLYYFCFENKHIHFRLRRSNYFRFRNCYHYWYITVSDWPWVMVTLSHWLVPGLCPTIP